MEQVVRKLNWIYYGQMIIALIVLTAMYYAFSKGLYEPLDRMARTGVALQYIIIFDALVTIPLGLYLIKLCKPQTENKYFKLAATRILLVSNSMPLGRLYASLLLPVTCVVIRRIDITNFQTRIMFKFLLAVH